MRVQIVVMAALGLAACAPTPPTATKPVAETGIYGARTDSGPNGEPIEINAVRPAYLTESNRRQRVAYNGPEAPGTIVVDPDAAYLHLITEGGRALRYGVSVGAAGFGWNGDAVMQFRRKWPVWKAPDSMIARRPEFAPYSVANGGMPGGPGNPMGARALYLFQNQQDTLYRIHGACEPKYLGRAVSSGCIRLLDQDIIDLERRVRQGASVRVLPAEMPVPLDIVY